MELIVNFRGQEYIIPDTIFNTFIVVIILAVLGILVGRYFKRLDPRRKPGKLQTIFEVLVEGVDNLVETNMGKHNLKFAPYIFSLALFLIVSNLFGLTGLTPPTADISVTMSLALITFLLTQIFKFRSNHGFLGYLKSFTEPLAVITPVNIIGELAAPISLSFRLFGNIMSGGLIMTLIYTALGKITPVVAAPLHGYFDLFAGVLQTFIFVMLTMLYIGGDAE
ncbi:MAG: F0F1 ATP synthase subunit A [Eubacteriales bacterium]|nr:F0F1 ATP synthase subunit A [Eubacteriales bacterium]